MGIDRQNIPEEYKCELCQPRSVDFDRARTLQLLKRKEQQNFLMMNTQQQPLPVDPNLSQVVNSVDRTQLNTFSTIAANKKKGTLGSKSRKSEDRSGSAGNKRKRSESSGRGSSNNKRREVKKQPKRKSGSNVSSASTSKPPTANAESPTDKNASNLRNWIENYESAMTNHYSPELRARLHSIGKTNQSSTITRNLGQLDGKCTTVPHAGGKILISTLDIQPNNPVIEVRGKHMLSTQYKAMAAVQNNLNAKNPINRNPGPFIFFYRLPNDGTEICVDTRTYGNEARFVRRSCRPNAEIQHSIEKGTLHLYIVSLSNIRSSTEVTIKHEPHDLELLSRSELTAPTSTICACGLIKDCLFGAPPTSLPPPLSGSSSPVAAKKLTKRANGHIKDKSSVKRKNSQSNRNRSTSSSGDSNFGNITNTNPSNAVIAPAIAPVSPSSFSSPTLTNDTELILTTSSASPPIEVISNQTESTSNDLVSQATTPLSPSTTAFMSPVQQQPSPPQPQSNVLPILTEHLSDAQTPAATDSVSLLKSPERPSSSATITPVCSPSYGNPKFRDHSLDAQSPISQPLAEPSAPVEDPKTPSVPTTPTPTPISTAAVVKSPIPTRSIQKKTPRKSSNSQSEDSSSMTGEDSITQSVTSSAKKDKATVKVENKKMTREERKMEAIVRAFEKMEKTEQRKNEQNKQKTTVTTPTTSGSGGSSRKRILSSSTKDRDDGDRTPTKRSNSQINRRKRKRGKSYSQSNHRPKRRTRLDSHNSEIGTSEDSSTPMMSPKALPPHYDQRKDTKRNVQMSSNDIGSAAGLLLSLSSYSQKNIDECIMTSPERNNRLMAEKTTPNTPPFPISSACLLIEAAVGPLDKDFKLPTKAKTKKSIMNDWLHQSDAYPSACTSQQLDMEKTIGKSEDDHPEYKHELNLSNCAIGDYTPMSYGDQPQNLSIAAKKIEEFIATASGSYDMDHHTHRHVGHDEDEDIKWHSMHVISSDPQTVPTPFSTPPIQLGSSVKKRWLRQAISEECSDDVQNAASAASSPPNGFTAPLKKRRVVRQCSDLTTSDNTQSPVSNVFDSPGAEKSSDLMSIDKCEDYSGTASPLSIHMHQQEDLNQYDVDASYEEELDDDGVKQPVLVKEQIDFIKDEHNSNDMAESKPDIQQTHDLIQSDACDSETAIRPNDEKPSTSDICSFEIAKPENDAPIDSHVKDEDTRTAETNVCVDESERAEDVKVPIETSVKTELTQDDVETSTITEEASEEAKPALVAVKKESTQSATPNETVKKGSRWDRSERSSVPSSIARNEIEDIQQKLHSFHSENLMILQSRNKKRVSRATTPTTTDESRDTSPQFMDQTRNARRLSFDDRGANVKRDSSTPPIEERLLAMADKSIPYANHSTQPLPMPTQSHTSPMPTYTKNASNPSYTNYMLNNNLSTANPMMYPPPKMVPPNFQMTPNNGVPVNSPLYHYLENTCRPTNYDTLSYLSSTATILDGTTVTPPATMRQQSMFNVHQTIPPPTLLNSSNFLTKSYSTLADPATPSGIMCNASNAKPTPPPSKVLTRTQCNDPRLNPQANTPSPAAPKRKLSINEYRKRKQLTSSSSPGTNATDKSKAHMTAEKDASDDAGSDNNVDGTINSSQHSNDDDLNGISPIESKDTGMCCTFNRITLEFLSILHL